MIFPQKCKKIPFPLFQNIFIKISSHLGKFRAIKHHCLGFYCLYDLTVRLPFGFKRINHPRPSVKTWCFCSIFVLGRQWRLRFDIHNTYYRSNWLLLYTGCCGFLNVRRSQILVRIKCKKRTFQIYFSQLFLIYNYFINYCNVY